jgi:hypothetical protein
MKLVRLIKMCLNEMYSKVRIGFPIQNGLKQGDSLSPLLFSSSTLEKVDNNEIGPQFIIMWRNRPVWEVIKFRNLKERVAQQSVRARAFE